MLKYDIAFILNLENPFALPNITETSNLFGGLLNIRHCLLTLFSTKNYLKIFTNQQEHQTKCKD